MKKFVTLTIGALLAASSLGGGVAANAADGGTIYPEDSEFVKILDLTSLTDYAVEGGLYAFADGNTVKILNDGEYVKTPPFEGDVAVSSIDIKEGVIYCGCQNGVSYSLTEEVNEQNVKTYIPQKCEYTFNNKSDRILYGDYLYNIHGGKLYVSYLETPEVAPEIYEGSFSNLKQYGGKVYAVNNNCLYEFTGSDGKEILLEYTVDTVDLKIAVGQASSALKSYNGVNFVKIDENAIMTAVDLEKLSGQYFEAIGITKAKADATALLLCYSGNAAIVSIGSDAFLVLRSKTHETEVECSTQKPFETAQMTNNMIYASPYVVSGTASSSAAMSLVVTVLDRIELEGVLDTAFYEVEYEQGNSSVKGYVTEGFLTPYIAEDNKKPQEITDPNYSENSDTKTILIIFAVVVLVLAVFAYVAHIGASKKRKKSKKKEKEEE